jgi:hypothetical protein
MMFIVLEWNTFYEHFVLLVIILINQYVRMA